MEDWSTVRALDDAGLGANARLPVRKSWTHMAKARIKTTRKTAAAKPSRVKARFYSTSDGRTNFAGLIQSASVDKEIIGFERYGHAIAALVPIEAIWLLAGETVNTDTKRRVRRLAIAFVEALPEEPDEHRARRGARRAANPQG